MSSTFYIVHHEFKAGTSDRWWEAANAAMGGGDWDEAVEINKEKGYFNHSANAITADGPIYCIWETKSGITAEQFQKFIDGPTGPGFGQDALMNICKPIDVSLMNGQTPYQRVFS